jgi:hypothetical protein
MFDGGISDVIKGGIDLIDKYIPSEAEKVELHQRMWGLQQEAKTRAQQIANEADREFNQRIKDLEGTAGDLKGVPILGPLVLFARGSQRPIWGFATIWFDYQWFFTGVQFTEQQQTALLVINVLVLTFLFGERALKNLMPLIERVFLAKGKS